MLKPAALLSVPDKVGDNLFLSFYTFSHSPP